MTVGVTSIPRWSSYGGADHVGANAEDISTSMSLAVFQGLYDDFKNSSQLMENSVVCPSGNCTFSSPVTLQSVTMCHSCRDVTDRIRNGSAPMVFTGHYTEFYGPLRLDGYGSATFDIDRRVTQMATNTSSYYYTNTSDKDIRWPDGVWPRTSLVDFQGIANIPNRAECPSNSGLIDCDILGQLAFDCSLRPCVKTIRASITNHKYTEEEVARAYMHAASNVKGGSGKFQLGLNRTFINGTWETCQGQRNASESHPIEVAVYPTLTDKEIQDGTAPAPLFYPEECVYEFGIEEIIAMYNLLSSTFKTAKLSRSLGGTPTGIAWLKKLWAEGNITMASVNSFAENLANTIGQEMRSNGGVFDYDVSMSSRVDPQTQLVPSTSVPIPAAFLKDTDDSHEREPCI